MRKNAPHRSIIKIVLIRIYLLFKNFNSMQHKSLIIIALISLSYLCISMNASYAQNNSDSYVTITGTVKDGNSRKNLGYINVVAKGKNISTVTNGDGYFSLKISKQLILKNKIGRASCRERV